MTSEGAKDWIALVEMPLDIAAAERFAADAAAGGICSFAGTTRAETNAAGQKLVALDYEAYAELATKQLHDLAARARAKWPVVKLVLLHRLGRVAIAEASVLIVVSTPHRAASFEACRFLIDELKKDVAIWKKEVWAAGDATWVHPE
jgi:molybdopterin synthase catalytic subunit